GSGLAAPARATPRAASHAGDPSRRSRRKQSNRDARSGEFYRATEYSEMGCFCSNVKTIRKLFVLFRERQALREFLTNGRKKLTERGSLGRGRKDGLFTVEGRIGPFAPKTRSSTPARLPRWGPRSAGRKNAPLAYRSWNAAWGPPAPRPDAGLRRIFLAIGTA